MSMDQPTLPGMGHLATQFSPVNPAGAPSARARLSRAASTRVSYEQRSEDGNISLERMADGSWKTGRTIWGAPEGANEVIKLNDAIPEALKAWTAWVNRDSDYYGCPLLNQRAGEAVVDVNEAIAS